MRVKVRQQGRVCLQSNPCRVSSSSAYLVVTDACIVFTEIR